uniref:HD/PDEase domain-containing protein n=1 Tax=viral metagenome TaxID=1070528 RepID=A0A6C0LC92_9ZZZZ
MSILNKQELLRRTEEFAKDYMKTYDDSHSFEHVVRVKNMATKIALSENLSEEQIFIIQLAALTHDINDSKYKDVDIDETQQNILRKFFDNLIEDKDILETIINISCNVSLSVELFNNYNYNLCNNCIELDCIRDADRIDSLGSIGISRYFTYGIIKKNSNINDIIDNIEKRTSKIMNSIKTNMGKNISYEKYKIIKMFIDDYYNTMQVSSI